MERQLIAAGRRRIQATGKGDQENVALLERFSITISVLQHEDQCDGECHTTGKRQRPQSRGGNLLGESNIETCDRQSGYHSESDPQGIIAQASAVFPSTRRAADECDRYRADEESSDSSHPRAFTV